MNIGKVIRKVVSTVKNKAFENRPLLLVQPLGINLEPKGSEVLCIDFIGVDLGEIILIMKEGSSVQQMLENKEAPADAAVVGVIDEIHVEGKNVFMKYPKN
ncbi:MAG: EutN/CcmL family microcompartment protein [Candidatus Riflebacteria bacterium]|nr:EutN/CcmL family microcompartment protein [Candidatus Riflebacteria bacterium]